MPGSPIRFTDVSKASGADDIKDARGMALADFDNDGDLDIIINNNPGDHGVESIEPTLLRNDVGQQRNWLAVKLTGVDSNRDAVGARVIARLSAEENSGAELQVRHVTAGCAYASQHTERLVFGLGSASGVKSLRVIWPSGLEQELGPQPSGVLVVVEEGGEAILTNLHVGEEIQAGG